MGPDYQEYFERVKDGGSGAPSEGLRSGAQVALKKGLIH